MMLSTILKRTRIPILKAALKLPSFITRPLSVPITENEGVLLDNRLRWFLRLVSIDPMSEAKLDIETERSAYRQMGNSALAGPKLDVNCNDDVVPSSPPVPIRIYRPKSCAPNMASIFWMHGGGWLLGDLDTHDRFCRRLCSDANVTVIAADYRRCPEHEFPAPLSDVMNVWQWLIDQAETLGLDRNRMALGGDSAGGALVRGC